MTNYTKTTDFAAKDALPSGNSAKIVKGSEIDTEFNNIATASATKANKNDAALTGTTTFETISDGTIAITAFVDEDNMASNSATLLPTQQSVKAYVDSQVTAQDLDFQADSGGALSIDLDSETLTFTGGTGVDTSGSGNAVTFAIDSTVATLTGSQTLSNKTLATPVVSGNLTTDGLIDGRDVATDGTKLDGIEAGATADQTAAEIRALVESATDSNVFTDADHSKLNGIEASADVTDTANVTAAGALMDSELTSEASVKALNQGVATTDSPSFAGLTTTANISFGDNDKAIFGAGSDLEIFHSGTHSIIRDNGTGDLRLEASDDIFLRSVAGETYARFRENLGVELYYDNNQKFTTNSTGCAVTGTVTADGLTVDGTTTLNSAGATSLTLQRNSGSDSNTTIVFNQLTADSYLGADSSNSVVIGRALNLGVDRTAKFDQNGDISFYEDTGTTAKFFWDSSAESLGIGTTSPSGLMSFAKGSRTLDLKLEDTAATGDVGVQLRAGSGDYFGIAAGGGTGVGIVIDDSNNVGIGTSSPNVHGWTTALSIDGGASNSSAVELNQNGTKVGALSLQGDQRVQVVNYTANPITFHTNGIANERMRIDSLGNVGIGTSSPTTFTGYITVHHKNTSGDAIHLIESDGGIIGQTFVNDASGVVTTGSRSNHPWRVTTNDTERLRIDSSGNVNIYGDDNRPLAITSFDTVSTGAGWDLDATSGNGVVTVSTGGTERMRIDSSGNVGINTSSLSAIFEVRATAPTYTNNGTVFWGGTTNNDAHNGIMLSSYGDALGGSIGSNLNHSNGTTSQSNTNRSSAEIQFGNTTTSSVTSDIKFGGYVKGSTTFTERMRIDSSGNVGIGVTPSFKFHVKDTFSALAFEHSGGNAVLKIDGGNGDLSGSDFSSITDIGGTLLFGTNGGSEAMRIDSSGNLLVGKSVTTYATEGAMFEKGGALELTTDSGRVLRVHRTTDDGSLIEFNKDSTSVGSIGTASSYLTIGSPVGSGGYLLIGNNLVHPATSTGGAKDNAIDIGGSSNRFKDIYATNGTIQTSDRNEKQDIEALSDAEQRVAVAAKGLLRKFRWKSAVEEKGDDARIHFGIIAQDLQAAFEAEGLDAGRYAMFINTTWTDEETGEERSRMGVRYSELLAFIIAAI